MLECADAHVGMGRSLACGVRARPDARGWIIALADMPYIKADTIRALVAALDAGASHTAPFYRGKRGHPVGFSKVFFEDLIGLQGDKGAQEMLRSQADGLCRLACSDPGILWDIDVPRDIQPQDRLTDQEACIALTATSDKTLEAN